MRSRRHLREPEVDPFYDMLFNMLIAFVFCFIVALLAMNPKATKAGDIPAKAEFIITMSWPDYDPNDIDLWVRNPRGDVAWFRNREVGLMHLDRDDRGIANDVVEVDGKQIVVPARQEVVTIRGIVPGEYVVNAHYFPTKDPPAVPRSGAPVDVTVNVIKVNPRVQLVYNGTERLARPGDETTMLRFRVNADGSAGGVSKLPAKLVETL